MVDFINITGITQNMSLSEFYNTVTPLSLYVGSMVIYAIFIFKFYRFIARKDILQLGLSQYSPGEGFLRKFFETILYAIEYLLLFPIFTFFWFLVMSVLFIFVSKNQELQHILLISMALVAVIRISAYFNEDLSKDLAKMLPFALLAVFLIDQSYFSFSDSLKILKNMPSMWKIILYYLLAVIALEFVLRILDSIVNLFSQKDIES